MGPIIGFTAVGVRHGRDLDPLQNVGGVVGFKERQAPPRDDGVLPANICVALQTSLDQIKSNGGVSHLRVGQAGGVDLVWGTRETSIHLDDCDVLVRQTGIEIWMQDDLSYCQPFLISVKRSRGSI